MVEQKVVIRDKVEEFLENLPSNAGPVLLDKIKSLGNPNKRRELRATKVEGLPPGITEYKIKHGRYRVYFRREGDEIHVVDGELRHSGSYGKKAQNRRKRARRR